MKPERFEQIYEAMSKLEVTLSSDPRTQGSYYITSKIAEVTKCVESLNILSQEVERAWRSTKSNVRILRLKLSRRAEHEFLNSSVIDGLSFAEKQLKSKHAAIQSLREDDFREMQQANKLPPGVTEAKQLPTIEDEILELENLEDEILALRKVMEEKRKHFSDIDSGIRLQERSIDAEMRNLLPGQRKVITPEARRTLSKSSTYSEIMGEAKPQSEKDGVSQESTLG
jgi:predicted  nucleic acid-binding Zn-ribbon protein